MHPEDLERVKIAHQRAGELPPAEREQFLQAQFRGEPDLQEFTRQLLSWHDEAGDFLNTPLSSWLTESAGHDLKTRRLGPWELIRELGTGGSATVYLARRADDLFEKHVAIKILNRLCHSEDVFRRFKREIQILARVEHPYIVRLLEAGTTGEALAYLVTEFVDGTRIDEFAASLPLDERLLLFIRVCEGVAYAHENHIVHRDIKPSNILVTRNGTPKLLDFGIALLLDQGSDATATGMERMTLQYASPEQIRREKEITPASDVYSLGVVLHELIAGRSRYRSVDSPLAEQRISRDLPRLTGVPPELEAIVLRALRKDPAERYDSVAKLAQDVRRFLEGTKVDVSSPFRMRRRQIGIVAAATLGVLLTVLTLRVAPTLQTGPQRISLEAKEGLPQSLALSPDGKRVYYLAGDRFFEYSDLYVKDLQTNRVDQLTTDGVYKVTPAVSRDGKLVAFQRSAGPSTTTLAILPASGGRERTLFTAPMDSFAWGADNRFIIVAHKSDSGIWPHLRGFDLETKEWWNITDPPTENRGDRYPVLSPDGKTLCFVRQESREAADLFLLSVDQRLRPAGAERRLTSRRLRIAFPHWSSDGKEIVYASGTLGNLRVFRVAADARSEPVEMTAGGSAVEALAVSNRGTRLILARWKTENNVWRLDIGEQDGSLIRRSKIIAGAEEGTFSPNGKLISFISDRSGEQQVWTANSDGSAQKKLTSYAAVDDLTSAWLPDSSGLLLSVRSRSLGAKNFVVTLPNGPERELTGLTGIPCGFSRDGKWLYFNLVTNDTDIYKYSMSTSEIRQVTRGLRGAYAVESPDAAAVYFSKPEAELGVWKMPLHGGAPLQVLNNLARRTLFDFRHDGIAYVTREQRSVAVKLRRSLDGTERVIYRTRSIPNFGLNVSPDGRSILMGQQDVVEPEVLIFGGAN